MGVVWLTTGRLWPCLALGPVSPVTVSSGGGFFDGGRPTRVLCVTQWVDIGELTDRSVRGYSRRPDKVA